MENEDKSVFPILTIDRQRIHWEDYLLELTPVQLVGGVWFKREDMFAPLGLGGINGSKLRQAIYMFSKYHAQGGKGLMLSGASVKSPQLPMGTAVAKHFGYDAVHVIGATTPERSIDRDMVKMATWFGAKFEHIKVGYNPVLQKRVHELYESRGKKDFILNYGITCSPDSTDEETTMFHMVGANQVQNVPEHIETIILPTGSCNSAISVLTGIFMFRESLPALKRVILVGIGPDKLPFIHKRFEAIKRYSGLDTFNFQKCYEEQGLEGKPVNMPFDLFYFNLFKMGYTDYQANVKCKHDRITFHPTYEAKVMKWVKEFMPEILNESTLFWIIGSQPTIEAMQKNTSEFGEIPKKVCVYEGN